MRRADCSSDSNAILYADDPPWEKATGPQDLEARRCELIVATRPSRSSAVTDAHNFSSTPSLLVGGGAGHG